MVADIWLDVISGIKMKPFNIAATQLNTKSPSAIPSVINLWFKEKLTNFS